jgi:hypothetical protein
MRRAAVAAMLGLIGLLRPEAARASGDRSPASFAIIIGSNVSVDAEVPPLMYADDDAVLYQELFRQLGARTYLLTRLDDNTRRLHPQAAAEAADPRGADLDRVVAQLTADVAQARDRHVDTVVYFIFAGHGNVRNGEGYVSLEDRRVTGSDLAQMVARVPATHVHVVADACASYFLANGRGPGGERRPLHPFQDAHQLADDPRVGLLLSTSSARESHEWDAFQAGVFSHEVRSGLYGAADADGDGQVSYREIAAFVTRANAAIPNERFRPDVWAQAPRDSDKLLDLRDKLEHRLDIDGAHAAHYWLEDAYGVRLVDFNNAPYQTVKLLRPEPASTVYLHRVGDDAEYTLPPSLDAVRLGDLTPAPARVASRGAAGEAFSLLFSMPFDETVVDAYEPPPGEKLPGKPFPLKTVVTWSAIGFGAVAIGTGALLSKMAMDESKTIQGWSTPQASVLSGNSRIQTLDVGAGVGYVVGGLAMAAGLTLLLWPDSPRSIQVGALPSGTYVGYGGRF